MYKDHAHKISKSCRLYLKDCMHGMWRWKNWLQLSNLWSMHACSLGVISPFSLRACVVKSLIKSTAHRTLPGDILCPGRATPCPGGHTWKRCHWYIKTKAIWAEVPEMHHHRPPQSPPPRAHCAVQFSWNCWYIIFLSHKLPQWNPVVLNKQEFFLIWIIKFHTETIRKNTKTYPLDSI